MIKKENCELEKSVILITIRITSTVMLMFTDTFMTEAKTEAKTAITANAPACLFATPIFIQVFLSHKFT